MELLTIRRHLKHDKGPQLDVAFMPGVASKDGRELQFNL